MTISGMQPWLVALIMLPACARLGGPTEPSLPDHPLGYWGLEGHEPMTPGTNIWICFAGTSALDFKSRDECKPSVPSDFQGLVFTNIGGGSYNGKGNPITLESMDALPDLAVGLRSAGFDGISFDLETVSGFTTYDELKDVFVRVVTAFQEAQMLTLLTVAKSGWTGSLSAGFPEGAAGFSKFQQDVGPVFDIFSPQCYGNGDETGPVEEICGVSTSFRADYSNWKGAKLILPSVGSVWLEKDGGSDPLATLKASSIWPSGFNMPGYAVWVMAPTAPTCPEGLSPFSDTPSAGVCTCGTDWPDANNHPDNSKC